MLKIAYGMGLRSLNEAYVIYVQPQLTKFTNYGENERSVVILKMQTVAQSFYIFY